MVPLPENALPGDLNRDGRVSAADGDLLLSVLSGEAVDSPLTYALADLDGDGRVNLKDALALSKKHDLPARADGWLQAVQEAAGRRLALADLVLSDTGMPSGAKGQQTTQVVMAHEAAVPHQPPIKDDRLVSKLPNGGDPFPFPLADSGFLGITNTGWAPPDPHMAAGPTRLVAIVNGGIAFFEKDGTRIFQDEIEDSYGFWGSVGATDFVFDPEVIFDPHSNRFMAMANERGNSNDSYFLLAVSDDSDPMGTWYKYRINVTALCAGTIDSPNLGVDDEAVYLTADCWPTGGERYAIYILDKAPLLSGGTAVVSNTMQINGSQSHGIPVMYGTAPAMYMIEHFESSNNTSVRLHAITNPLGSVSRTTYTLSVPSYGRPEDAPQLGTSTRIETFDARFWSCVWRNGSLWACHHIDSSRVKARWYEIATNSWPSSGSPSLVQSGTLDPGAGVRTFFNAISVDAFGNAAMCFARSSTSEYISMGRVLRQASDPPGTMQAPVTNKESTAPLTYNRWGDYSAVSVDPADGKTFWTIHEYTPGGNSWNSWIAYFEAEGDLPPLIVTGPGPGPSNPPQVRVFSVADTDTPIYDFAAYGVSQFGVNISTGQLDGDDQPEIATGPGPGAVFGPHVRGWELTGSPMPGLSFLAYGTKKFGSNVTLGDIDGDGLDEIVTGAGPGAVFGPHVRGFNYDGAGVTPISAVSFMAYGTRKFGVNVACGDADGDGMAEIVTGAGPGAVFGPHVRGFNYDGISLTTKPGLSYFAYGTPKYGVNVACGGLDGNAADDIITGPGPGAVFSSHVRGWWYTGSSVNAFPGVSFFAYEEPGYGVRIGSGNLDGDGYDEILTAPGPGAMFNCLVRGWNVDGGTASSIPSIGFNAYEGTVTHGGNVAAVKE
jgi:hypothetical protein